MNYAMKLTMQDLQEAQAVQNEFERTASVLLKLAPVLVGIGYIFDIKHKAKRHLCITHNVFGSVSTTHYLSGHKTDLKDLKKLLDELKSNGVSA